MSPPLDDKPGPLLDRLDSDLKPAELGAQRFVEGFCREQGVALYLVGGAVRDLMLGRPSIDLDLVMEGAVAPVAEALASESGGRAVIHERFGTATVFGPHFRLDLAQTRRETYWRPGALPAVEPVTDILDDLSRRDFSMNAMALRLTEPVALIDPFGGAADLGAGLVRVLHERSFQDDATRMLRAARYASRLEFQVETLTQIWLQRDLAFLETISGPRLRRELTLMFEEPRGAAAALLASRLEVLGAVHPRLHVGVELAQRWSDALAGRHYGPRDELGFCLIGANADEDDVGSLSGRLHLSGRLERALREFVRLRGLSDKLAPEAAGPADLVDLLDVASKAAVWALSISAEGRVRDNCRRYLEEWQSVRPALTGKDLLALGMPPGESMGEMLRRLRRARLSGEANSREDEERIVREELERASKD